ncbi:leucine-rich repeat domain-containing protein, partial [Acinetobacter baumannii]|nr:leucine-rich repeat domain-containing protein [Acinetobacter baumannii]
KPELKELKISSKNITSLGGLTNANFPKLETLDLKQASNLKDISALANGPKGSLSKIDLGDTQVKDITPLKGYNN